jgi:chromate transporter
MAEAIGKTWKEIAVGFLKVGATAYGGPAIMGVMQAEFQERRQWTSKPHFLEGLALVSVLPGATATQLGIFLGHARGGWWGGLLAGVCFAAPGPVVLAIFVAALFRLGRSGLRSRIQAVIAVGAAITALWSPLGPVPILLLSAGIGLFLFHGKRVGSVALVGLVIALAIAPRLAWWALATPATATPEPTLGHIAALFAGIGALTVGGGLTMIALMQEHVVERLHWLTPREFVDGLALGQLTPGPVLMLAAYVGYKVLGVGGAVVAAAASFLPSFVLMLGLLPVFERIRMLGWARAAMQGVVPAVIGVMATVLARLVPHAAPDPLALGVLVVASLTLIRWRLAPLKAMLGGSVIGVLRDRLADLPGMRALLCGATWGR